MSTSSFGSWYDEQRAAENGDAGGPSSSSSASSWFSIDSEQVLPLFNSENLQGFSIDSMKQTMEGSMPKKILGMGYQQRFKVSSDVLLVIYFCQYYSAICCLILNLFGCLVVCLIKRYFVHYYSCRLCFLH
jgi:hypothetical protein